MVLYTIGFTKKPAEQFFESLRRSGVKRIVDVRLNNVSQLAGFAKRQDLAYFARAVCNMDYVHLPVLAPTQEMLDDYKKRRGSWEEYARRFQDLMSGRKIETQISRELLADACLLCSEDKPHRCHRRLVAEYLRDAWGDVDIRHIV